MLLCGLNRILSPSTLALRAPDYFTDILRNIRIVYTMPFFPSPAKKRPGNEASIHTCSPYQPALARSYTLIIHVLSLCNTYVNYVHFEVDLIDTLVGAAVIKQMA